MAPSKFGLFTSRSREQHEQPSTENLLQSTGSLNTTPGTPIASTSKMATEEKNHAETMSLHNPETGFNYQQLNNDPSIAEATCTSTLEVHDDLDLIINLDDPDLLDPDDDASTSCDVNSIQFDDTDSIAPTPTEDAATVKRGRMKKLRKDKSKEEQLARDYGMWQASNTEVMQNLLNRSCTHDDQIKWEAIASSRGMCTLTDNCGCIDCVQAKYMVGVADGDAGLGSAPLAISVGCTIQ